VPALRLRVRDLLRDGDRGCDRDHAALQGGQGAQAGDGVISGRTFGRIVSYVVLLLIAVVGAAPFLYLLLLSCKSQLQTFVEVPPSLDIDWSVAKANYSEVIHTYHYFTYVENSIIVTGISTLIALVIGVPAAYAFSRLRFRGSETGASTILSFRFMPPVAVAIPIYLMIRYVGQLAS